MFGRFKLTPMPAKRVAPPLIDERFHNLECKTTEAQLMIP
jgi:flavin reductase (DIM6/NTAB) family NADH-FMN oxidoreductase RutF